MNVQEKLIKHVKPKSKVLLKFGSTRIHCEIDNKVIVIVLTLFQHWMSLQDDKDVARDGDSTPLSNFADLHSPATLTSIGSAISMSVVPELGPPQRDNNAENGVDFAHALPPIKNNYNNSSMLSPKLLVPTLVANFRNNNNPRLHTPKVMKPLPFHCNLVES